MQLFESKEVGGDQPRSDCECDDDDECGHLRSVEPDGVVMKWWRMNAPRSGPEFYHPDEKKKAQGPKTSCARKQAQGIHAMIPELCEFRVGDEIMVGLEKSRADSFLRAGFQVVRGSACLLRDPFWIETLVGYS